MRKLGYAFVTVSFLAEAYFVSLDKFLVAWSLYIPFLALGFVGIVLIKMDRKKQSLSKETFDKNISVLENSLTNLISNLAALQDQEDDINVYDFHQKIDEMLVDDINKFVAARHTISHVYNLQIYAVVMSDFAGGERYVNRIWSASVDGYIDEVKEYIGKALFQFQEAQIKLLKAKSNNLNDQTLSDLKKANA
jgi:hypothetical protein